MLAWKCGSDSQPQIRTICHMGRPIRDARTSTVIAAYRKEPTFPGDVTWEMAIAVTPLDGRPCEMLWDEGTVRYHIAPWQGEDGRVRWLPYCQEGSQHAGRAPIFLLGLGISNLDENRIWHAVKDAPIRHRSNFQDMYKNWVWDILPVGFHRQLSVRLMIAHDGVTVSRSS